MSVIEAETPPVDPTEIGLEGYEAVDNNLAERDEALPELEWEELGDGKRVWANIITDLPPGTVKTFRYTPPPADAVFAAALGKDPTLTDDGERIYEVGIDPYAIGELDSGIYRVQAMAGLTLVIEVVETQDGYKYFDITKQNSLDAIGPLVSGEDYAELATEKPDAARGVFNTESFSNALATTADFAAIIKPDRIGAYGAAVYEKLGFRKVHEGTPEERYLTPAPQTLQRIIDERNLPIQLSGVDQEGNAATNSIEYSGAFASAKFSIGISDLYFLIHDTTDDHFPAALSGEDLDGSGGENDRLGDRELTDHTLLTFLAPVVREILSNQDYDASVFFHLDQITSNLTVIGKIINKMTPEYLPYALREKLINEAGIGNYSALARAAGSEVDESGYKVVILANSARHLRNNADIIPDAEAKALVLDEMVSEQLKLREKEAQKEKHQAFVAAPEDYDDWDVD